MLWAAAPERVLVRHSPIPAVQRVDVEPDAVIQRMSDLPGLLAYR